MGLLWRLFAPKPIKKARRTASKARHPVHTAVRATIPKPVKLLERAAHPLTLAELKVEDALVNALRGNRKQVRAPGRAFQGLQTPAPLASPSCGPGQVSASQCDERPHGIRNGTRATLLCGAAALEVGDSLCPENFWRVAGDRPSGERVRVPVIPVLVTECGNPCDHNAVGRLINGLKAGHLPRSDAFCHHKARLAMQEGRGSPIVLPGVVAGGAIRGVGPGKLDVLLCHDPADFGP